MIIAIDGPSGAGKGTLAQNLAKHFDFAWLDTGLVYRAVAKKIVDVGGDGGDEAKAAEVAKTLKPEDLLHPDLRQEAVASIASEIAVYPEVRRLLTEFQRNFAHTPPNGKKGAVLDGRDIGTAVCPNADVKLFVTADLETRAERRYKELQHMGITCIYSSVINDLRARDERDSDRKHNPLKPAEDATLIDTSHMDAEAVFKMAINVIESR
jgi:cytidylate kinase